MTPGALRKPRSAVAASARARDGAALIAAAIAAAIAAGMAALIGGCSLAPTAVQPVIYDLGLAPLTPPVTAATPIAPSSTSAPTAAPIRVSDLSVTPWLEGTGINYRLAFKDAQRREQYRDSRWAGPPAGLVAQRLRLHLIGQVSPCGGTVPALLAGSLDEFEQVFSSVTESYVIVNVRATLWPQTPGNAPAETRWVIRRPAPSPDAAGAVRAMALAVDELGGQMAAWVTAQSTRCR